MHTQLKFKTRRLLVNKGIQYRSNDANEAQKRPKGERQRQTCDAGYSPAFVERFCMRELYVMNALIAGELIRHTIRLRYEKGCNAVGPAVPTKVWTHDTQ